MVHFLFKYSVGKEKSDSVWPSFQERDDVARKVFVKKIEMTLHLNDTNLTRSLRSRHSHSFPKREGNDLVRFLCLILQPHCYFGSKKVFSGYFMSKWHQKSFLFFWNNAKKS